MEKTEKRLRTFRLHSLIAIIVLVLEFVLGMYTALFVKFPESLVEGNAWRWSMTHSFMVMSHVILGTVLMIIALATLGFAFAVRKRVAIITSVVALVMVALAYMSGTVFLSNIEEDAYSFAMAMGFVGAMVAYGLAYHLTPSPASLH
jgi:hypothetical protein